MLGFVTLAPLAIQAQSQADPYFVIAGAVKQAHETGQFVLDVGGMVQTGSTSIQSQLRIYVKAEKFLADGFIDNERKQQIVCDGSKVWRYDPVKNEYSYLAKPDDTIKSFGLAAAWARTEFQRPLRLLAMSSRWLTSPKVTFLPDAAAPESVRLSQVKQLSNGDWRGTDLLFEFDAPNGKMRQLTIQERQDLPSGNLRVSQYVATFHYPPVLNMSFLFKPPSGSKPAADLPARIGG